MVVVYISRAARHDDDDDDDGDQGGVTSRSYHLNPNYTRIDWFVHMYCYAPSFLK